MRWFKKEAAKGSVHGVVSYAVATYILPLGAPVVTVAIGYASGLPWFWIWLGALAAFAFISTGLLRFDEWLVRRRVEGKLSLSTPGMMPFQKQGYAIGVQMYNNAEFPIEVELIELRTQINHKLPSKKRVGNNLLIVNSKNYAWFYDNPIELEAPKPGTIEGTLEAKLRYGLVGSKRKYALEEKKQITARFDEEGNWAGNALWTDIIEN